MFKVNNENTRTTSNDFIDVILLFLLLTLNIQKGMNIKEINRQIQRWQNHVKAFPGAISTQLNHYVTPTLEVYSYDAAIIHVGINDILRPKHYDELDKLPGNIIKVGNTCQK